MSKNCSSFLHYEVRMNKYDLYLVVRSLFHRPVNATRIYFWAQRPFWVNVLVCDMQTIDIADNIYPPSPTTYLRLLFFVKIQFYPDLLSIRVGERKWNYLDHPVRYQLSTRRFQTQKFCQESISSQRYCVLEVTQSNRKWNY